MPPHIDHKYWYLLITFLLLVHCKKPYEPPVITAANRILVVDGVINTGSNSVTSINLNRTRNLNDSLSGGIPELGAKINIVAADGTAYPLKDTAGTGIYTSAVLSLDNARQYKLTITTAEGRSYASDLVPVRPTPPMDSVWYEQPGDLTFYVNTHDPSGNTRYYRWDYLETWEHDAQLQTVWGVKNGMIFQVDSNTQHSQCWTTRLSPDIHLGSSSRLNADVIERAPLTVIPNGDSRLDNKYSILIRQYALTVDAYNYWSLIQKTSERVGTLFDLQPTQLTGNIHSLTSPGEPVIGYISACSISQQRLFLFNTDLQNWAHNSVIYSCDSTQIPVNPTDYRIYTFPDTLFAPWYFISNGPLVLASKQCLDCTLFGGSNKKPSYWR